MVDTPTADDGSIDAVAASLIDGPPIEDEHREDEGQPEGDAQTHDDADDAADAVEADADADEGNDESDADADEGDQAEQLFTVKVDGREQQVNLNELLRGYSGQSYIQKGMQEVATAKQQATEVYSALQSERQQLAQFTQAVQTGQIPMQPPAPPSEELLQRDPIGYLEARVRYDKEIGLFQQGQMALQELNARTAQAEEHARRAHLADQHRMLAQAIPAFAKPETAAKIKQELIDAGQGVYGFDMAELQGITDHRALRVLHDAAQYRRLMSGKPLDKQVPSQPKTPVIKPGVKAAPQAGKRVQADKAKTQMKRTGSVDDVARFLLM